MSSSHTVQMAISCHSSYRTTTLARNHPKKLRNATCTQNLWSVSERPFEFSNDCYLSHSPTLMSTIQHNHLIFPEQTPLASLGPIVPGLHSSRVKPRHPQFWHFFGSPQFTPSDVSRTCQGCIFLQPEGLWRSRIC